VNVKEWRVTTGKSQKGIVFYLLIMALVTLASTYSLVTVILNVIFFFTLEHYFGSVFLRSSFLINYWRPLARCSMKLFSLFGVKKEGKINKKKGENELKLLKINK